jgi:hypothetical protein
MPTGQNSTSPAISSDSSASSLSRSWVVFSGSSRLSGSNHSVVEDSDKRIGFLSWIGPKGSAASLVRIVKDRSHLEGSSGFFEGSSHHS